MLQKKCQVVFRQVHITKVYKHIILILFLRLSEILHLVLNISNNFFLLNINKISIIYNLINETIFVSKRLMRLSQSILHLIRLKKIIPDILQ